MRNLSYMALGLMLGALATLIAQRATAQDPVKLSPQYYSVRFENDRARVLEYHLKPGEKEPIQSHGPELHMSSPTPSLSQPTRPATYRRVPQWLVTFSGGSQQFMRSRTSAQLRRALWRLN